MGIACWVNIQNVIANSNNTPAVAVVIHWECFTTMQFEQLSEYA